MTFIAGDARRAPGHRGAHWMGAAGCGKRLFAIWETDPIMHSDTHGPRRALTQIPGILPRVPA